LKELSKTYNPQSVENQINEFWGENNFFSPSVDSDLPVFSVVIPPPNVTGNLTIGHMLNNTIQDIYVRWKRMSGFNTLWLPGTDHAGIATQTKVEAHLKQQGISKYDLGRDNFIKKVWEWKEIYHSNIVKQLKKMGASVDWNRERFTLDDGLSLAVRKVFVDLYNKGLIYKGKRIINWDPEQQTALSDEEVIYKEKKGTLYYIKYPIIDSKNTFITIATTRPETMLGDTAVAVNPDDTRYSQFIGKKVLLPIAERIIPIIADKYVDMEFGTGALKITPAHDPNDFEIGQKYSLPVISVIDHTGKMNENAGKFSGLDRFEARKLIVEKLHELNLLFKQEDYIHNVGFSERGGAQVEPYLSDQWFVKMKPLAEPALNAVLSGEVKFHPERWVKTYEHWMNNIKDWCISRQLWWGHRIPVWYHKSNQSIYCDIYPPSDIENWEQDPDVLDTWFSSWLWPFSTLGWPEHTEDLKKFFPTSLLSTGPDIIFFWVARMIMASIEFTGKIPFKDVYFHNIVRDSIGRKLSKSLGNSPDVIEVMDKYGTDALRFTLVYLAPQGTDIYFSEDKCEIGRNFANKIWNAARFLLMKYNSLDGVQSYANDIFDSWIQSRLNSAIRNYLNALNEFKINEAVKELYDFIWGDYCDWYIEILKIKDSKFQNSAKLIYQNALSIFETAIMYLHPVMPFITERLWQSIKPRKDNQSISVSQLPPVQSDLIDPVCENNVNLIQQLISSIRNMRAELNIPPSKKCDVVINTNSIDNLELISHIADYIENLSKIDKLNINISDKTPEFKAITSVIGPYQIFFKIEGIIDIEQEKIKIQNEISRTKDFISSINKKLSNEKFVKNASAQIVEKERKKLEDNEHKLQKLIQYFNSIS
jgi:valyl-tRNA synthetase